MSVHPYKNPNGDNRWRVRWRTADGRMHSKSFAKKKEANAWDAEVATRKNKGEFIPSSSSETLGEFAQVWWADYVTSDLAKSTQLTYWEMWENYIAPHLAAYKLVQLSASKEILQGWKAQLQKDGTGAQTQRKAITVLSSLLTYAVDAGRISRNMARELKMPAVQKKKLQPLSPFLIELVCQEMANLGGKRDKLAVHRSQVATKIMGYAGLRPGECWALTWNDIGDNIINVDKALKLGEEGTTKTDKSRETILIAPLRDDLAELYEAAGKPDKKELIFPMQGGGPFSDSAFRNWRRRVWAPAAAAAAERMDTDYIALATPYTLRASFCSNLLRDNAYSGPDVASFAGHSVAVLYGSYSGVLADMRGKPSLPYEQQVQEARKALQDLNQLDAA